jgi:hypothetical protein
MQQAYLIDFNLVDPTRLSGDGGHVPSMWSADGSAADSDSIAARNGTIAGRLAAALPGLGPSPHAREDLAAMVDDGLSAEALLRRYHRAQLLSGPWEGGEVLVWLFDDVAEVTVVAVDIGFARHDVFGTQFAALLERITAASGLVPWDVETQAPFPNPAAAARTLLARHAEGLGRLASSVGNQRLRRALGIPSAVLMTLLAVAAAAAVLWHGVERGTLMAGVDESAGASFQTDSLPPPHHLLGLFPRFALDGRVGGSWLPVRLPVYRDQYLSAGPGAIFPVLPTSDPATPFVLRSDYENTGPLMRVGGIGIAWPALTALIPLGLWVWAVALPIRRMRPGTRDTVLVRMTALMLQLLGFCVFVAGVVALRLLL